MNIRRYLVAALMAVIAAAFAAGQDSYLLSCRRFPDDDNLNEKVIMICHKKSSGYTARGDLNGLSHSIEVMSDLNSFDLPLTNADIQIQEGILSYYMNKNVDALANYLDALELFNRYGFTEGVNSLLNNIAIIFSRVDDYESTLKYLRKALEYTDISDIPTYSFLELNIAETETRLKNYGGSLDIAIRLFDEYDVHNSVYDLVSVTGVIIDNYNELANYEEALEWIELTPYSLLEGIGYMDLISFLPQAMETYYNLQMYDRVIEAGKIVYPPPDPAFLPDLYEVLDLLSRVSIELRQYSRALEYEDILRKIEFSRTSIAREDLVSLLMTDYAFNIDNLARLNLDRELSVNNDKDRALKKFILEFLVVIVVVSAFTFVLLRLRKTRKAYRRKLARENNKLALVNRELMAANKILEKENSLLDTLISVFAHDLINPFQAILGFSKLMISDYDSIEEENIIEYTSLLSDTSFQLNQLLTNLRNMAVLQEENRNLEADSFRIDPVIYNVINLFTPAARKKNIEFRYSGNETIEGYINTDIFQSVIRNVISNALKFSKPNGFIDIEASVIGAETIVKIKDYGTGMPEEIRQKLLSGEFLRSSPGTLKEKGSGLGLTICIELLERCAGKIEIETSEGYGTLIKIIIPFRK